VCDSLHGEGSGGRSVPFHGTEHLVGARGQILLIISNGVLLSPVASTVGANGCIPYSGNFEPVVRLWRVLFYEPRNGRASPTTSPL